MSVSLLKGFAQVKAALALPASAAPAAPAAQAPSSNATAPSTFGADTLTLSAPPAKPVEPAVPQDIAIVNDVYQRLLGRTPDPEGLQGYGDQVRNALAAGKSPEDITKFLELEVRASEEYGAGHVEEVVNGLYQEHLGRDADAEGLKGYTDEVNGLLAQGKTVADARGVIAGHLKGSEEYRAAHPSAIDTNRDAIYLRQPNDWSCGPTSLTMAMKALGLRNNDNGVVNEMIGLVGATPATGVPGNASLIANAARKVGAQAEFSGDGSPGAVRAALEKGHGVVLNGSLGTGGHFIYVAGLNPDGRFIICDPWRPGVTAMNDAELNQFANTGPNPRGFAEIWT